jgi:Arc/MetJ-type ribon-helix-helix transcriptional regulator
MNEVSKSLVRWELLVPCVLDEQVMTAIRQGKYASKSDLIRDAVRKCLEILNSEIKTSENAKRGEK